MEGKMKRKQTKHPNKELSKMKRFQKGMSGSCKNIPEGYDGNKLKVIPKFKRKVS